MRRGFQRRDLWPMMAGAGVLVYAGLLGTAKYELNAGLAVLVFVLLLVTMVAWLEWLGRRKMQVPVWPLLCTVHFVFFGLACFHADRRSPSFYDIGGLLTEESLQLGLLAGVGAVLFLWLGRRMAGAGRGNGEVAPEPLAYQRKELQKCRWILAAGIVFNILGSNSSVLGPELRNLVVVVTKTIPMIGFAYLVLRGQWRDTRRFDIYLLAGFFLTQMFAAGQSGAVLGEIVMVPLVTGLALWVRTKRAPWKSALACVFLILFLQLGKNDIRIRIGNGEFAGQGWRILPAWVAASGENWKRELSGEAGQSTGVDAAVSRASVLSMVAVVMDKTPDVVPYRNGEFYPLVVANLIPRFLWPDKPTVNVANRAFQLDYGLTREDKLDEVSIACGFAAEGYLNFGWLGLAGVCLLTGVVFGLYEKRFFAVGRNGMDLAIGLALLPGFLTIESQMAQYVGGLLQSLVMAWGVFGTWRFTSVRLRWSGRANRGDGFLAGHGLR